MQLSIKGLASWHFHPAWNLSTPPPPVPPQPHGKPLVPKDLQYSHHVIDAYTAVSQDGEHPGEISGVIEHAIGLISGCQRGEHQGNLPVRTWNFTSWSVLGSVPEI